jgi:hypothetical protein
VLVRVSGGDMTVHEARVGGTGTCANLPVSSCLNTVWSGAGQRVIGGYQRPATGEMSNLSVALVNSTSNAVGSLDICFTPMGRTFVRESTNDAIAFAPLTQTYVATVSRPGTRARQVVLMPNGTARMY